MFVITSYKRFDGETEEELILRICENKEQIGSWEDVAAVINKLTGNDFGESTYRKKYQSFKKMLEANQSKFVDSSEQLEEIRLAQRELERSKIQFRDERRSWQKQNYIDSRFDEVMNLLVERLDNFGKTEFKNHEKPIICSNKAMIVCLSDLHIGQTFESNFGEFNSEIAKDRLGEYLNKVIEIGKSNNISKVYVFMLGDNISNIVRFLCANK